MLTRLGVRFLAAAVLALVGAATSGANLLYLIDGMLWSILAVSWWWSGRNLRGIGARAVFPEQMFVDTEFPLAVFLRKEIGGRSHFLKLRSPSREASLALLKRGKESAVTIPAAFPRRGLNEIGDIWLESDYPFGLFRRKRRVTGLVGLVFPPVFEIYGRRASPAVRGEDVSIPKRGAGGEFFGLREYDEGEDARLINWKLTAKTGKPLVKEYAEQVGNRITITVADAEGPDAERQISEAASLAKYFIDAGSDVRLRTPEATVAFGHGLIHLGLIFKTLALLGRGKIVERFEKPLPKTKSPAFPGEDPLSPFAYSTVLTAFASLFLIEELNPLVLASYALLFPLAWLGDRKKRYLLPRPACDALAALYLLFFLFVDLPRAGSLGAVTRLVLFILGYLLFNPKTGRAPAQLLTASFLVFFLASGQALSLWYFAFFLAFFLSAGAWLIDRRDPRPRPRERTWGRSLLAVTGIAVILAAAAFVVLPRPYSARMRQLLAVTGLTRFQQSLRTFSGMSEQVELGYLGPIHKNSSRVMRVMPGLPDGSPVPEFIHVRGAAFDFFDGRRWRKSPVSFTSEISGRLVSSRRTMAWIRRERGWISAPGYDPQKPFREETYVLSPFLNTSLVFFAGPPGAIEANYQGIFFDFTDTAYFPGAYLEGISYRVRTQGREPSFSRSIRDYGGLLQSHFLQQPGPNERLRRLAVQFAGRAGDARSRAAAVEARLRGGYSYSLAADLGRQDIDGFLFESKAGNCEYFATAMCLLLRHLDIPSRLAVGFLGSEWNEYGKFFDIRQSDAHAWVEAYLPESGWTTFDPTPPDFTESGAGSLFSRLWSALNDKFEDLQFRWYRYVVGYDTFTQRNFLYNIVRKASEAAVPLLFGLAGFSAALFLLLRRKSRGTLPAWKPSRKKPEDFYETLLVRLGRAGFPRRPSQTAAEYAGETGSAHPELGGLTGLARRHYELRYAGRVLEESERAEIARTSNDIAAAARRLKRRRRRDVKGGNA
ncbi:MAG: transglutaminaseTgpA domain-containing protein [Acidobacteriota bacterium]|nr:transglutaminaseTgpA domain-containing protein [Acidobacteriota bacterium]